MSNLSSSFNNLKNTVEQDFRVIHRDIRSTIKAMENGKNELAKELLRDLLDDIEKMVG